MPGNEREGERPQGKLTARNNTTLDAKRAGGDAPALFKDAFDKLSETPPSEDPVFWPVRVLNELHAMIIERHEATDSPNAWGVSARAIGERFAPFQEHIRNVKTAYEILAYPHCPYEGSREVIEGELAQDQKVNGRDQVELNDAELAILRKLTASRRLPLNPEKRVYRYAEVLHPSPKIERALNGAEFIKWLGEQNRAENRGEGQ